ncbi:hypothetical protein EPD60_05120 [Flaviaesturariibacter flavus]|uniref:Uncharacterized protein n=1 Tax=Flaviaesturariibacter flavus TaxID=2502780 RepID=A0A4R1BJU7_9BACT|nr:hypothetical protein [Flaviaesturariibacter flavus]TCJ17576.1 hypothetical protein EPD60_05120 [Flaviaesturariibacter flavus]
MRQIILTLLTAAAFGRLSAQELYPYTEPASNMPTGSISTKLAGMYMRSVHDDKVKQRYVPEVMLGLNRKWMVHGALLFSDMHGERFMMEGARAYAKYRFLSNDDVHQHFRMAAFGAATWSRNHLDHNDINLWGDQSGVQGGIIATQLINRWAFSATADVIQLLPKERWEKPATDRYAFQALQYALSAGVLVLPRTYTDYRQTNLNLYLELLGHRNLNFSREQYYVDLAPAVQLIFNSTGKLNFGYRFELASDIYRFSRGQFMVSYEHIFLDAIRHRKKGSMSN